MTPHNLSALFLTLSVADFRKAKKVIRTLGSMGVYDFDSIVEQIVLGISRRRDEAQAQRDERSRQTWNRA